MKKLILAGFVAVSSLTMAGSVLAGDAVAGKAKAASCVACHGTNGISIMPIYPNLAGQKDAYLEAQIKAFRDGTRTNATMAPMVKSLTDADAANIAAFFSAMK